jgi:hypothetical protein
LGLETVSICGDPDEEVGSAMVDRVASTLLGALAHHDGCFDEWATRHKCANLPSPVNAVTHYVMCKCCEAQWLSRVYLAVLLVLVHF